MIYQAGLWKMLFFLKRDVFQLGKAETIYGLTSRVVILFLISAMIFTINGLAGIGSHVFSFELIKLPASQYEWLKSYFILGRFLLGILYAGIIIFFSSLLFWTLTNVPYKKLVVMQAAVFPVLLLEQAVNIVLVMWLGLPWYSSPFSMGAAAQYMTESPFFIYFLGCISIFKVWVIAVQIYGLSSLSRQRKPIIWLLVLGVHLIYWLGTSFLAFLDFQVVL
ncbi:hypothetical protein [Siminovitchia sp. 179-K 8D1 HS]|uniref:hypothetical protein n=1 Tax=Siminovitchia sp. 179-K 8D1 HS TaxID=3142385 RepID=UPI00399F482F